MDILYVFVIRVTKIVVTIPLVIFSYKFFMCKSNSINYMSLYYSFIG